MPTYSVKHPDGRTLKLKGEQPPSVAELDEIFAKVGPTQPSAAQPPTVAPPPASGGLKVSMRDRALSRLGLPADASHEAVLAAGAEHERGRTAAGANLVPAVTGTIGGMVGGVPGAVAGGMVGEAVKQTALRGHSDPSVPNSPMEQAKDIAVEGGMQGAVQGAGSAMAYGGGKLATWLMNRATTRVTQRLMRDFPNLSDTLIDNALTVSKGGYDKARSLLLTAKAKATLALTRAEAAGATVPIQLNADIAESFKTALIEQAVKKGQTALKQGETVTLATNRLPKDAQSLLAQIDEAAASGEVFTLSPKQADLLKAQLQKESRELYANRTAPNGPRAMAAEATLKAEMASRLNDALDALAGGYKAANAEAQKFIGATRGLEQATRPNGNLYQAMVRPAIGGMVGGAVGSQDGGPSATVGALTGAAMASPRGMSIAAISLKHPAVQAFLKQLPRGVHATVMSALQSEPAAAQTPSSGPPR